MTRLSRLLLHCALLVLIAGLSQPAWGTAAARPNVLIIVPDDISFGDFSTYHPDGPRTPNIDRLGRESVRLTDFHVSPTCSPTRAALMTGRYNDATGVWHTVHGRNFLRPGEITMADVFKANGYRTAIFGKWHLGDTYPLRPKDRGFEHVVIFRGGGVDQQHDYWGNRNNPPAMIYVNDRLVSLTDEDDGIPGAFATNFFTSRAIGYIQDRAASARPFFVYLAYNVAHAPHDMPPDARPGIDAHTATVENLDKNVGRVLGFLDASGLADNTLVIFFTDNGAASAGLRGGKGSPYEGGHRVPCFVRWPAGWLAGTAATSRDVAALASHIDLLPTLMDLIGLHDVANRSPAVPIQGLSIRELLAHGTSAISPALRNRVVTVDNQRLDELKKYKQGCVMRDELDAEGRVTHRWRLMPAAAPKDWELYDLVPDPLEKTNLAAQPRSTGIVAELKTAYEVWWRDVSARAGEYVRPVIGSDAEPVTCLYAHDWHSNESVPWRQTMVANGMGTAGFNAVEFAQSGTYTFDLRRWPREIADETTATSVLRTPILDASTNRPTRGTALAIHSARLRVWNGEKIYVDERRVLAPEADGVSFTIRGVPAGPALVQAWFYSASGQMLAGVYYNYVSLAH